ncbi:hypothetical protein H4582DRAFT_2061850 [Lactarius indigo]|nr:hypothetical protein H4582DRAFT_2061850 [Lactarius indigo]
MPLRSLEFNDRRDVTFYWNAQLLQVTLDSRPIIKFTTATAAQQTTCLKNSAPLDPTWKRRVQRSYKLLIDTLFAWARDHRANCPCGGAELGSGKDAQLVTVVDPPPKRQPTGDVPIIASVLRTVGVCVPTEFRHAAAHINQGTAAANIPIPHTTSALGGTPVAHHTYHYGHVSPTISTNSAPISSPVQAQASAGLAALESMLATFPYLLPPANTDRLAEIRAAKVAILNGQHQSQSRYSLPGWPAPIGGSGPSGGGGGGARK